MKLYFVKRMLSRFRRYRGPQSKASQVLPVSESPEIFETEVKFRIDSIPEIRDQLHRIGAELVSKAFEYNLRFDDTAKSVSAMGATLRLRRDRQTKLTFKAKPDTSEGVRVSEKLTVKINDFDTMKAILERLGYWVCQQVEKEREAWQYQSIRLCIDTLPMGQFLEIQGPKRGIRTVAQLLGLDFDQRILEHYGILWGEYCKSRNISQNDILFDRNAVRVGRRSHD